MNDDVEESEIEDVDVETEEDIYLRVLEYIRTVDECIKVGGTVEEIVPPAFHAYLDVFRKEPSECFILEKSKIFLLLPDEREEMSSFVRDQLWKGYI